MPYSVQFHQDFFIHGIPYYPSGEEVNSQFSGGCLRVSNENAKQIYDFAEYGMRFIVFDQSVPKEKIKEGFSSPIDPEKYWIRQDFNSPLKIHGEYLQHAGVDMSTNSPEPVMSIYDGEVAKIQIMGNDDFGFGNTVIIKHIIEDREFYSLYAHLETISQNIYAGKEVKSGEQIGLTGASGYGCQNY
ncbi:MAG: peptidoglycan DD-metalloendopeptidase family protein [Candidatus Methanofastidiosum sp.]|jgi:murein DD-endopeptidase MepM/ murein hydrolase activator NlpD|nr:peptidoglycan DD-metalloendopeptidase family protein [Methanofastidiosum sp.]